MTRAAALKAWETRRARGTAPLSPVEAGRAAYAAARERGRPAPLAQGEQISARVAASRALEFIPPRDTSHDEEQWTALATEHATTWADSFAVPVPCGVKYADRPHPQSYGADLPMRAPKADYKPASPRARVLITTTKPHPDSYRPDLPLSGLGLSYAKPTARWTLTAAEKKALAGRPVTITPDVFMRATFDEATGLCTHCVESRKKCLGMHRIPREEPT